MATGVLGNDELVWVGFWGAGHEHTPPGPIGSLLTWPMIGIRTLRAESSSLLLVKPRTCVREVVERLSGYT